MIVLGAIADGEKRMYLPLTCPMDRKHWKLLAGPSPDQLPGFRSEFALFQAPYLPLTALLVVLLICSASLGVKLGVQ